MVEKYNMERKEQIEFKAGSTRDGLIANYVPTEQAFMYEDGFKDGANWADNHPKKGLIDIKKAAEWIKNAFKGTFGEGLAENIKQEFIKKMTE